MSDELDLDMLEQDARSAFILHEYKSNRYYVDERGWEGKEPIGGYGYRDKLLAEDFLALIERLRKTKANHAKALRDLDAIYHGRLPKLERVREVAIELADAIDRHWVHGETLDAAIVASGKLRTALDAVEKK